MKTFNPSSTHPARAVQAWQILTGLAMNQQTLTYKRLSELMYRKHAAGVLSDILGHIAYYCNDHKIPPLTVIVVGQDRGTPGSDIPINPADIDKKRQQVFTFDWYDVYPPSEAELRTAFENNKP